MPCIFDRLIASVREGRTFVMVSHDLDQGLARLLLEPRARARSAAWFHFGEKNKMSPDGSPICTATVGMGVS